MESWLGLLSKQIIVCSVVALICKFHGNADVNVVPHWNNNSEYTKAALCHLTWDSRNKSILTVNNSDTICSLDITTTELGIVVKIPRWVSPGTFVYAELIGGLLDCQNKYVDITADEPCGVVFSHSKLKLFAKGNTNVQISDISLKGSLNECQNSIEEHPALSNMTVCPTNEFKRTISCFSSLGQVCSFELLSNCYVILGNRNVKFNCPENNTQPSHKALIIYPDHIMELRLSGQDIAEINEDAFISVTITLTLNVSHNKILKLHRRAFNGLKKVTTLSLQGNQIDTLDAHIFDGMFELSEIDLSENSLSTLANGLFRGLNLLILNLNYNRLILDTNLFNETRNLFVLSLQGNDIYVFQKDLFQWLINLRILNINDNQMMTIDADLFNRNTKLINLNIGSNKLTVLPNGLLQNMASLQTLNLDKNLLEALDRDLFNDTKILASVDISSNKFTILPSGLFKNTKWLNYLNISSNNLIRLPRGFLKGLIILETLDLLDNRIKILDGDLFNETRILKFLRIESNNLTFLPNRLFKGLTKLETLDLMYNQIEILDEDLFNETRNLITLNIKYNRLTHVPSDALKWLSNLELFQIGGNQIMVLNVNLFNETRKLTHFSAGENKLFVLPCGLLYGLYNLKELYIYKNKLAKLDATCFHGLRNLRVLMMHTNTLTKIDFRLLRDLKMLEYYGASKNELTHLDGRTFQGLEHLQILTIRFNRLQYLDANIFKDTINLHFLDLSGNQLTHIPSINHLRNLQYFNLLSMKLTMIDRYTFKDLPKQAELVVNQTEICVCYVPSDIKCTAVDKRSPYLTCQRLLSDRVLMVMMWFIGINAVCGNVFVLGRKKDKNEKKSVQTFLLSNLAMSDLLMGIYMLLIASADIYFGEKFPMRAEAWRSGITCRIAGALSIISSEASVFFLTVISIDRFINIRFPFSEYKLRKSSSAVWTILIWLTSLTMGILPVVLAGRSYKFYDNSHVCIGLPLAQIEMFSKNVTRADIDRGSFSNSKYTVTSKSLGYVPGLYYGTAVFLGLNGVCFVVIMICYIVIIRSVIKSNKNAGLKKDLKDEMRMTMKIAAIVLTDFCCWFPIIMLGILVQFKILILPPSVFAWCVTVILPINSAINPYLYTIAAYVSDRRKEAVKKELAISK